MILSYLRSVSRELDNIQTKLENTMATLQNFKDLLDAIDTETTRIAAKIDELVAKLAAGGMTEAEEAEVLAGLSAVSDHLKTIGADPVNPIPTPEP